MMVNNEKSYRISVAFGEPGGIRTHDLLIRSQTLYPAELRAHTLLLFTHKISLLSIAELWKKCKCFFEKRSINF